MKKRDYVLIIGSLSFLTLIIFLSLLLADKFQVKTCGCPKMVSHNFILFFIILAVIFVSSLLYYLFSLKIDEKEKIITKNIEILKSILDTDEKKVLDKISKTGELEQKEISEMFDKIKAHRVIKKLYEKGIIEIEKKGKTNKIKLNKELKKELSQ
ncbi:MAG: hypothetical protein WC494_01200 [Candidatus Pacearchaeota archaeon]